MKKLTIRRPYTDEISYYEGFISIILASASIRMTPLYISVLAHAALYQKLDKEVKTKIAEKNNTNLQVIANTISKLRKDRYLDGAKVNPKLNPPKNSPTVLELVLHFENAESQSK